MKDLNFRTLITEEEKNRILGLHNSYNRRINPIYEQTLTSDQWLGKFLTKAQETTFMGQTAFGPDNKINVVPGGKIYIVDDRYELTPSYSVPACNADKSNQPCWSLDSIKILGYVDATKYVTMKSQANIDQKLLAANEYGEIPYWFTDNGNAYGVVIHNGVAYSHPPTTFVNMSQQLGLPPAPINPALKQGTPEGLNNVVAQQGQQDSGGGGEEEDKKELEVVKNDMQYSKGDVRRLKRNLNRLKRYRKRKGNMMTSTIKAQFDAQIKDLEAKVGKVQ